MYVCSVYCEVFFCIFSHWLFFFIHTSYYTTTVITQTSPVVFSAGQRLLIEYDNINWRVVCSLTEPERRERGLINCNPEESTLYKHTVVSFSSSVLKVTTPQGYVTASSPDCVFFLRDDRNQ